MTIVAFDLNTVDSSQGQLNIDLCQEPIRARLSNPLLYGRAVETTWTLP